MASTVTPLLPAKTLPQQSLAHFHADPKPLLLHQCRTTRDLHQLHAHIIKTGLCLRLSVAECLLESAALHVPGSLPYALKLFDKMPRRNTAAYNIMIRGFNSDNSPEDAILLFKRMLLEKGEGEGELGVVVVPDKYSFSCALKSCSRLRALREGEQIHTQVLKGGCISNRFVENTLLHMYASCGRADVARKVFDGMVEKNCVTWNAMFAGYSRMDSWTEVVELFREMLRLQIAFDDVTMICVLTACGRTGELEIGEFICGHVEENGLKGSINLMTALVDMYAKCGELEKAKGLFDEIPSKDVVAWSAMISGYSQSGHRKEALELFHEMQMAGVEPNEVTMVSVLSSCAVLGALETGRWVHSFVRRKELELTVNLGTALVDLYAKCGAIDSAVDAFKRMPKKNVLSWTVLIQGLANNGRGREALDLFYSMLEANVQPNDVTFIGVLSACSHTGLVEEGKHLFDTMSREHRIPPRIDHYGCMVDLLGRAGLLGEAYDFIKQMPIEPNAVVWRTLLSSCKVHRNVEIGEESLKEIMKLETRHSGDYILLSSIYASVGRWEDALKVRAQMKEKEIKKSPGCTLIEIGGMIHEFFAEDCEHPESKQIYDKLEEIIARIKLAGYVPKTEEARFDAEEDEKEVSVSHHSEKLAIAYGLIKSAPGAAIRISKNLRVCTDCHVATKLISEVYRREIVVRDRHRFHHFKDGSCSCKDYW